MPKKRLVIAGTGQLSVLQILDLQDTYDFLGFIDDNQENARSRELLGNTILGGFDWLSTNSDTNLHIVNSIARTCAVRHHSTVRLSQFNPTFGNLLPKQTYTSNLQIGFGNIIGTNVTIEPNVKIGNHNIILSGTIIAHDTTIGNNNFFGLGVLVQGGVQIGNNVFLSAGTIIEPEVVIADSVLTMAGAIIYCDILSGAMALCKTSTIIPIPQGSLHSPNLINLS